MNLYAYFGALALLTLAQLVPWLFEYLLDDFPHRHIYHMIASIQGMATLLIAFPLFRTGADEGIASPRPPAAEEDFCWLFPADTANWT